MVPRSVIVHEWFYEGGPDAFEYLLPCESVYSRHAQLFDDWVGRFIDCPSAEAARELQRHLDSIDTSEISRITKLFRGLAPHALMVHNDQEEEHGSKTTTRLANGNGDAMCFIGQFIGSRDVQFADTGTLYLFFSDETRETKAVLQFY